MTVARNIAIVLALAAAVAFIPGAGTTAAVAGAVLSTLILVALVFFVARLYREHRLDLDILGDRWRGVLYGAVGVITEATLQLATNARVERRDAKMPFAAYAKWFDANVRGHAQSVGRFRLAGSLSFVSDTAYYGDVMTQSLGLVGKIVRVACR